MDKSHFREDPARTAAALLRLGLGFVFLYAALGSLTNPTDWIGYVPDWFEGIMSAEVQLKLLAIVQLVLTALLVAGVYVREAAVVSAALLAGITLFNLSLMDTVFRDVGLFFAAALALVMLAQPKPAAAKPKAGK